MIYFMSNGHCPNVIRICVEGNILFSIKDTQAHLDNIYWIYSVFFLMNTLISFKRDHSVLLEGHRVPVSTLVILLSNNSGKVAGVGHSIKSLPLFQVRLYES